MNKFFAALDLGTTHIKAVITDDSLKCISSAALPNSQDIQGDAGSGYDANTVWSRAASVLKTALKDIAQDKLCALSVTGMADSGLLVDGDGNPLTEVIPWSNTTGSQYRQEILAKYPLTELYRITGQTLHPKFALSRLLWYREHRSDVFAKAAYWLSLQDYIVYRLTGRFVTDESLACRTMLFDVGRRSWQLELCDFAHITGRLPEVLPVGAQAGTVTAEAAVEVGCSVGVRVHCAGHDHPCALFALHHGGYADVIDSMGTSEVFTGVLTEPLPPNAALMGINHGCFADGMLYWMANLPSSGASLEWLRAIASVKEPIPYSYFDENTAQNSGGVMYLPFINGGGVPDPDPSRRGAFLGLSSGTTLSQLACAVNEGIGFETRRIMEALFELTGKRITSITAAGGGARNKPLLQAKANITGIDMQVPSVSELTAVGAVLFAVRSESARLQLECTEVSPEQHCPQRYQEQFDSYVTICNTLYQRRQP